MTVSCEFCGAMETKENRITELFGTSYPIVQAGMIWCSGWELASAVSNAGALGLIGSGSMYPEILRDHIRKCKAATDKPFGVNLPLIYPQIAEHISVIKDEGVVIVFTSAGNPRTYTQELRDAGITVVHVVSSSKFALKAQEAGCQAVVAEGFEAGGHNGREETTTMCLIPAVVDAVEIPVIAAGGIFDGRTMAAAFALGAEAVQVGSRFVVSNEASAHNNFKNYVVDAGEGQTQLTLKELTPVRLMKNDFFRQVQEAYANDADNEALKRILGRGRAKKGMFEGDLSNGELEIGQASAMLREIIPAAEIVQIMMRDFNSCCRRMAQVVAKADDNALGVL